MSRQQVLAGDAAELAQVVATRLLDTLIELQRVQDDVRVCLTGGTIANKVYERFADLVPGSGLDVDRLAFWWGDERFVASADEDRNARQALRFLGGPLLGATFHAIPASDQVDTAEEAARSYAEDLPAEFHLELLGMGPDGHCLSIFPHHPSFTATPGSDVIAVHDSPKPPPTRVSLTPAAASRTQRLWVLVSGEEKAQAAADALAGDADLPVTHVSGTQETVWFLDEAAASRRRRTAQE